MNRYARIVEGKNNKYYFERMSLGRFFELPYSSAIRQSLYHCLNYYFRTDKESKDKDFKIEVITKRNKKKYIVVRRVH